MPFTEGLCQKIQQKLNNVAGANAPALKRDKVGYVDAVMSGENKAGFEQIQIDTGKKGGKRMVQIDYYTRATEAEVDVTCTNDCDAEVEPVPSEAIVEVTNCVQSKGMTFNEDEMRKLCEGDEEWVANNIMGRFNALNVTLNKQLLAQQALNFGNFIDGTSTPKQVKLFEDTTNQPRAIAMAQVQHELDEVGASGRPMIIGSGNFDLFAKSQKIACCNNFGQDISQLDGTYAYYNDRFVNSVIGANNMVALAPGAVQLITWNRYVGNYAKSVPNFYEHGTIVDPYTGLRWDTKFHYDDCADVWTMKLQLYWELFFIPNDAFAAGDDLNGVNYTFNFEDCSTIAGCVVV